LDSLLELLVAGIIHKSGYAASGACCCWMKIDHASFSSNSSTTRLHFTAYKAVQKGAFRQVIKFQDKKSNCQTLHSFSKRFYVPDLLYNNKLLIV
jgi:hypothetical protein